MPVYLIAAAEALFYLCAVPVNLAVRVDGLRSGAGLSAFEGRVAVRRARQALIGKNGKEGPEPRRVLRVLRRVRLERATVAGRAALGDAAATALFCGGLRALLGALPVKRLRVDLRPDFSADRFALELSGMFRARSGQIILATLIVLTEEAFSWTSTRLKT